MSPLINICLLICLLPNLLEAKKFDLKQSQRQLNLETVDSSTRARRGAESVAGSGGGGGRIIRIMIAPPAPHQVTTTKHIPGLIFHPTFFIHQVRFVQVCISGGTKEGLVEAAESLFASPSTPCKKVNRLKRLIKFIKFEILSSHYV